MVIVQLLLLVAIVFVAGRLMVRLLESQRLKKEAKDRAIIAAALATPKIGDNVRLPISTDHRARVDVETEAVPAVEKDAPAQPVVGAYAEELAVEPSTNVIPEPEPVIAEDMDRPQWLNGPLDDKADDLTKIRGVGKVIETNLNDLGIFHYRQIAQWSLRESIWIEGRIGFTGRVTREGWVAQANKLSQLSEPNASSANAGR